MPVPRKQRQAAFHVQASDKIKLHRKTSSARLHDETLSHKMKLIQTRIFTTIIKTTYLLNVNIKRKIAHKKTYITKGFVKLNAGSLICKPSICIGNGKWRWKNPRMLISQIRW